MAELDVVTAVRRDQADLLISVGGGPGFPPSAFEGPLGAEEGEDEPARVLREQLTRPHASGFRLPRWRLLVRSPDVVLFHRDGPNGDYMAWVQRTDDGLWHATGSHLSEDRFRIVRDGNIASDWRLNPSAPAPTADTTELSVLVTEIHCASAQSAHGRIEAPDVKDREKSPGVITVFPHL